MIAQQRDPAVILQRDLELVEKQLTANTTALTRADEAFTNGIIDAPHCAAQVKRIQEQEAAHRLKEKSIRTKLAEHATEKADAARTVNAREYGIAMLEHQNDATCNGWLGRYVTISAAHHRIAAIVLL